MRTIDWNENAIQIIDQTALPGELRILRIDTIEELVEAIQQLAVRGAPALGAAGALGVALAAVRCNGDEERTRAAAAVVRGARPTAVNLAWGVDRALGVLNKGVEAVVAEARNRLPFVDPLQIADQAKAQTFQPFQPHPADPPQATDALRREPAFRFLSG